MVLLVLGVLPCEISQDPALDEILDLFVGLLLDKVVDECSGSLTGTKICGLSLGVEVLRGRLEEGIKQLESFLHVDLVGRVQGEVLVAGEGQESLLIT